MIENIYKILIFLILLKNFPVFSISMVYNFRIAQVTKRPILDNQKSKKYTTIGLLFDVYQKKYCNNIKQNFAGELGSFIYNFKPYYFRTDFAISSIKEKTRNIITFSGKETDDILFTLGRNFIINNNSFVTLSGLFGVPTHKITTLKHVSFGYGQVGLGVQFDGSYQFNQTNKKNFIIKNFIVYGTRYIYFVPGHENLNNQKYKFSIGNIFDFLIALNNRFNKHGFEAGYTTRFDFGAKVFPDLDNIIEKSNYIRNNFYAVYKYNFKIHDIKNRALFNIAYGFDSKPKTFGNKSIITFWASWNINF